MKKVEGGGTGCSWSQDNNNVDDNNILFKIIKMLASDLQGGS